MSYEIVTSINFKKHSITSYPNNVFPRDISKTEIKMNDEEFMKWILGGFRSGDFQVSVNSKYAYIYDIIHSAKLGSLKNQMDLLYASNNKNWDYLSKELYRIEKAMDEKVFETYKNYKDQNGKFVIVLSRENLNPYYVKKIAKHHMSFAYTKDKARVYNKLSLAKVALRHVEDNYDLVCSVAVMNLANGEIVFEGRKVD